MSAAGIRGKVRLPKAKPDHDRCFLSPFESLSLSLNGFFLRDDFLGQAVCSRVRSEVVRKVNSQSLRQAGIGREQKVDTSIRGDQFCWMEKSEAGPGIRELMSHLELLRKSINREFYLGLDRFEMQLAHFAPGSGGYKKHLDAFKGRNPRNRRLTTIYYLNRGWQHGDGGELSIDLKGQDVFIEPVADRLVVFFAEQLEHAVLPNQKSRLALTSWFHSP